MKKLIVKKKLIVNGKKLFLLKNILAKKQEFC